MGFPSAPAVESVIACGSRTPAATAASSHSANSSAGVSGAPDGSNTGSSPANTSRPRGS
ncbi:hypothetical protein [Streptomyces sp. NPDC020747]|uniref:hypothetical protein n=1 Tax=Streptomyces sp. NPDC020747 TaxID=3365086 RepID=UPI0037A58052